MKETPFDPDDVVLLDKFQRRGTFHPFTCPNRGDGNHREMGGDLGALLPTVRGWVCAFCDYTQNWAHKFMVERERSEVGDGDQR